MFQDILSRYDGTSASLEIFAMLFGAFVLWVMFAWLIKPKYYYSQESLNNDIFDEEDTDQDDLLIIEGIDSGIEKILHKNNVFIYRDIIYLDVEWLEEILKDWPKKYRNHNPATWPDQARIAAEKKFTELEEYQEILNAGRKNK